MRSDDRRNDGGGGTDSPTTTTAAATVTGTGTANNVVRWEKFLPKTSLRVLLVEADDSTRHIITALLKKCSYKVAAVSDGLKAWEVLKQKSDHIDLILTEVELPSISGFALLTLIMEHQVCKNIPVIMMSANDSLSTVYKCMLTGAADFLVKPVRKNELNNLWQHVWRRQASTAGGNRHQQETDAQQKVEATAENNATSNRSSGYMACIKRNRECIEKGSDAQSSCTKPDMELDVPSSMEQPTDHTGFQLANQSGTQPTEPEGHMTKPDTSGQEKNTAIDVRWENANVISGNNSREAINLIGSFDSYPKPSYKSSLVDHSSPLLDLSLRRSHPSSSVNQINEKHRLKHSDVSAFSRYINKTQPPLTLKSASISNQQKDCETSSDKQLSLKPAKYISVPVQVLGLQFEENPCATYGSVLPTPFFLEGNIATEAREDLRHISSGNDHNGSSGFCNGGLARLNSIGSGSNGNNNVHRSIQREAALNKFRMKRKDRCFDKKVRYESRKKLAEQRPRVKGQFVRPGKTNSSPMEVDTELATAKTIR